MKHEIKTMATVKEIEDLWGILDWKYSIDIAVYTPHNKGIVIFDTMSKRIIPQKRGKVLLETFNGVKHVYDSRRIARIMFPEEYRRMYGLND